MTGVADLLRQAEEAVGAAEDLAALDTVRVQFLGKKGLFTAQLRELGKLPAAEIPAAGKAINTAKASLEAAAEMARKQNLNVLSLGDAVEGEAREVGARHAHFAREVRAGLSQVRPPCVVLSGGETTVTVKGHGRGGQRAAEDRDLPRRAKRAVGALKPIRR